MHKIHVQDTTQKLFTAGLLMCFWGGWKILLWAVCSCAGTLHFPTAPTQTAGGMQAQLKPCLARPAPAARTCWTAGTRWGVTALPGHPWRNMETGPTASSARRSNLSSSSRQWLIFRKLENFTANCLAYFQLCLKRNDEQKLGHGMDRHMDKQVSPVTKLYVLTTGTWRERDMWSKKSNSASQKDPTYMHFKCLPEHVTQIIP